MTFKEILEAMITHSTKYGLTDITNMLVRAGPAASKAGLSFDDMTGMIEKMGLKGVPARNAVNQLNTAIADIQKTTGKHTVTVEQLNKKIGITSDVQNKATDVMITATGKTKEYDKIAEEHIGVMANISSWWEKTTTNIGLALTPYSSAFMAITALGGALTVINGLLILNNTLQIASKISMLAGAAATGIATAAQWLFNIALDANPIGLIILGIAGLVAGIYLLDQKFHFIQPMLQWFTDQLTMIADVAGTVMNVIGSALGLGGGSGIPGHASGGGMAAGEAGIVGERGPELWVPNTGGTVVPNGQFGGSMGGSTDNSTHTYQITIQGAGKDGKQIGQDIGAEVTKIMRQNRRSMAIRTMT